MKIGLRGGHSPNCKGAMGILDEQAEVRKIYGEMVPMLQSAGHTVINCNSNAGTVRQELADGTNKANANRCDIYITIHMNASSGAGNGAECWLYNSGNGTMNSIADKILQNFSARGFYNRGRKYKTGYHDLSASSMPAMIVETLFCDNAHDAQLYSQLGAHGIAELIAKAIDGNVVSDGGGNTGSGAQPSKPTPNVVFDFFRWVSQLQTECNAQNYSRQVVDGLQGKNTLAGCPTLYPGSAGNITRLWQEFLIGNGYSCGPCGADGQNGPGTQSATYNFQGQHGISKDKIVGPATWAKALRLS